MLFGNLFVFPILLGTCPADFAAEISDHGVSLPVLQLPRVRLVFDAWGPWIIPGRGGPEFFIMAALWNPR